MWEEKKAHMETLLPHFACRELYLRLKGMKGKTHASLNRKIFFIIISLMRTIKAHVTKNAKLRKEKAKIKGREKKGKLTHVWEVNCQLRFSTRLTRISLDTSRRENRLSLFLAPPNASLDRSITERRVIFGYNLSSLKGLLKLENFNFKYFLSTSIPKHDTQKKRMRILFLWHRKHAMRERIGMLRLAYK